MSEKKTVTPPEYVADIICALHESKFFLEHRISEEEVRAEFWKKIAWKAEVNEGYFALDEEEIEEVLCTCVDIGVDNTLAFLTEKGYAQSYVTESGEIGYKVTVKGQTYVDKEKVVRILQGKIK